MGVGREKGRRKKIRLDHQFCQRHGHTEGIACKGLPTQNMQLYVQNIKQLQQTKQTNEDTTLYNYAVRNTIGFDSCRMRRGMVFHRKGVFTKKSNDKDL